MTVPQCYYPVGGRDNFNIPGIEWSSCCSYLLTTQRDSLLITFAQDFPLEQIITEPTRGDNKLDLCFISHPNCIQHYKIAIVPGLSDHDAVFLDLYHHAGHNAKPKKKVYFYQCGKTDSSEYLCIYIHIRQSAK